MYNVSVAAKCSPALVDRVPTMVLEADRKVAQRTRGTGRAHKYKYQDKAKHTKGRNNKPILESTRDQTEKLKTHPITANYATRYYLHGPSKFWDVEKEDEGTR